MTEQLASLALQISGSAVLSIIVKTTLVLVLGLLLVQVMRPARASRRFVVLAWTFGILAAIPAISAFAPTMPIVVRETRHSVTTIAAPAEPAPPAVPGPDEATASTPPAPSVANSSVGAMTVLTAVWGAGALVSLMPVLLTLRRLRSLRRTARPLLRDAHTAHGATVLVHDGIGAPMTFGWIRPRVVLPGDTGAWSDADVERALVHELEHVRRGDWPVHVLTRLVCAFYWFNPLAWRAWRQLHLEADRACDDAVASRSEARDFAEQLVGLAGRLGPRTTPLALSMTGGDLVTRVNALLDPAQARGRAGWTYSIASALIAIVLGTSVSAAEATAVTTVVTVTEPQATAADGMAARFAPPAISLRPAVSSQQSEPPLTLPGPTAPVANRFEAATIVHNTSDNTMGGIASPAGNAFVATNVTIERLIRWAYGLGPWSWPSPSWQPPHRWATLDLSRISEPLLTARFEVRGKAPTHPPEPQSGALGDFHYMVQTLLAERFNLAVRWEPQARATYVLTLEVPDPAPDPASRELVAGCFVHSDDREKSCVRDAPQGSVITGGEHSTEASMRQVSMERIARLFEGVLQSEVVDQTGESGRFDVNLRMNTSDPALLRAALRRQFGIRLEPLPVTGETLVVLRAEMPRD